MHTFNDLQPASLSDSICAFQSTLPVKRLPVHLTSDDRRVIARPFMLGASRVRSLFDRVETLPEETLDALLRSVEHSYADRHPKLANTFHENYDDGARMIGWSGQWSPQRRLLAGAYLTMEYSVDSAALFNPSIVPHPDQTGVAEGAIRFVMSLRATGEGHVSSIVFRTGVITAGEQVEIDPLPQKLHRSRIAPDRSYVKPLFRKKMAEMNMVASGVTDRVLSRLPERFSLAELNTQVAAVKEANNLDGRGQEVLRMMQWIGQVNYHVDLAPDAHLSELVIFPMSEEQSNGLEDLRLTRFEDPDDGVMYHGTYTAYNGVRTLPMLLHTRDFRRIEFASLNGQAALNKGMALFPRKIGGQYVMCSRIDGENLFIAKSDNVHFWESAQKLIAPRYPWELMQIGNCGPPIETEHGWILLTHGVGPMRTYAIGAMLLDLDNPQKIIGHLREPIITPGENDREGYVPNVVYTCGAIRHGDSLFIPYGVADSSIAFGFMPVSSLLAQM